MVTTILKVQRLLERGRLFQYGHFKVRRLLGGSGFLRLGAYLIK